MHVYARPCCDHSIALRLSFFLVCMVGNGDGM